MTGLFGVRSARAGGKEVARRLLARAVFQTWGWSGLPDLERGPGGKPCFSGRPGVHFNLSHSGPWALCALSDEGPVGVDVELVRPRRPGLPRYVMSDGEFAAFDGTWEDFARIWTLKEAYVKYLGRSIWPPRAVPVPPPVPFCSYAGPDWRAALCGTGSLPEEIQWLD